jgi:hypothetical protein
MYIGKKAFVTKIFSEFSPPPLGPPPSGQDLKFEKIPSYKTFTYLKFPLLKIRKVLVTKPSPTLNSHYVFLLAFMSLGTLNDNSCKANESPRAEPSTRTTTTQRIK